MESRCCRQMGPQRVLYFWPNTRSRHGCRNSTLLTKDSHSCRDVTVRSLVCSTQTPSAKMSSTCQKSKTPCTRWVCCVFCVRIVRHVHCMNVILTISWASLFDPCWKTSVASSGCSRNMWQRVSSLRAKCLAAAVIQAGERSLTAPMDAWSSDTQPNMALVSTCRWHV